MPPLAARPLRLLPLSLSLLSACSWSTVNRAPPPSTPPPRVVNCTASKTAPRVDRTLAVVGSVTAAAFGAVALIEPGEEGWESGLLFLAVGLPAGLASIPFWLSSQYGYEHTGRCREILRHDGSPTLSLLPEGTRS